MVGDHPVRCLVVAVRIDAGCLGRRLDQVTHQVDIVIVVLALQDGGDPFQPHAGIDRRARQVVPCLGIDLLVLHEDEVPDFDKPVAVFVRAAGRAARDIVAMVEKDFRTRTARPGIAHRPEIVACRDADDAVVRQPGDLLPQLRRLFVFGIDGHQEFFRRQAVFPGHQVPRQFDRDVLEIIAEREIAEHFEKRVVARRVADVFQVVVLAAGAYATLRRHRAGVRTLVLAGEHILELHHARVGEQQGRVVMRHQRRRRHDFMLVRREIAEEGRPDVTGGRVHVSAFIARSGRFTPYMLLACCSERYAPYYRGDTVHPPEKATVFSGQR